MDIFVKAIAGVLIAVVLCLALNQKGKEISILLALGVCVMVAVSAFAYIRPVLNFFSTLQSTIGLDNDLLNILLKVVGVGILGEIASLVCADAGQASLGKVVQLLTTGTILWISLPLFTQILTLIEEILNSV